MRIELTGTPYLTQSELKEDEKRQIYAKLNTASPDNYRQATDEEIAEVHARIEAENMQEDE